MNRPLLFSLAAVPLLGIAAGGGAPAARTAPACCAASPAPDATHEAVTVKHTLTLDGAERVLSAAIAKARERNASGAVAVVDDGGHLIAFQRLDGTFAASAPVSIGKARTAALFRKPTRAFEESINGGRIALAAVHEMTPL